MPTAYLQHTYNIPTYVIKAATVAAFGQIGPRREIIVCRQEWIGKITCIGLFRTCTERLLGNVLKL